MKAAKKLQFKRLSNNGLTVLELIIGLVISLVIVGAASYIFLSQSGAIRVSKSVSVEQQRLNNAFSTVKYNLRMAGFDNGSYYFYQLATSAALVNPIYILPVMITDPDYANNQPYEVLINYFSPTAGSSCIADGNTGATLNYTGQCNFTKNNIGDILIISAPGAPPPLANPNTFCITNVSSASPPTVTISPGAVGGILCGSVDNPIPPNDKTATGIITVYNSLKQVLFYWGNQSYGTQNSGFNHPFNQKGILYKCAALPPPTEATESNPPTCAPNTTIQLDDNVNNFSIVPLAGNINPITLQPYIYVLSISGASNVAVTPSSPAYGVNTGYNPNLSGANPQQNGTTIPGYNVIKTLNANIFLRNVYYTS